jgi:hypothetical protein
MSTDYLASVEQYGAISSLDDLDRKAQLVGAISYRAIWENWNYHRLSFGERFCSGILYWYHNSPIRQISGRMWDWSLEPTAALYATQNALAPLHAQYHFLKNTVSVNNELLHPFTGAVRTRMLNLDGTVAFDQSTPLELAPDSMANDVLKVKLPAELSAVHFIRLDLADAKGQTMAFTFYWRSTQPYLGPGTNSGPLYGEMAALAELPQVPVSTTIETKNPGRSWRIVVHNGGTAVAFSIRLSLRDPAKNIPLRPTFYSDNFFSLLPGESRALDLESLAPPGVSEQRVLRVQAWNADPQVYPLS